MNENDKNVVFVQNKGDFYLFLIFLLISNPYKQSTLLEKVHIFVICLLAAKYPLISPIDHVLALTVHQCTQYIGTAVSGERPPLVNGHYCYFPSLSF